MARYILQILKLQLSIVWSWDFHTPKAIDNGLLFKVQGFKFKGTVRIVYNEGKDLFDIDFLQRNKVVDSINDVYFDQLVDIIDCRVEKVANYDKKVKETYSLL